ncbi:MAG: peptide chain release factor N(5)-glutamine methyltransferase [Peptococcaceae bacterium]|nr:peptide chain release factor N(5)-glutamine methyltransferase [Peptococcaceae bacterium]
MPTIKEVLNDAVAQLKTAGKENPRLDAEVLLSAVLGCDRVLLYREPERDLSLPEAERFCSLVRRRARGVPVAYLLRRKEFMGLDFYVDERVLVPRPETELLLEHGLGLVGHLKMPVVVDVGTGSGAIAVSFAHRHSGASVHATDISAAALEVAKNNARRHGVEARVSFYCGHLLEPLPGDLAGRVDLILANLPYIPSSVIAGLDPEVRAEPHVALDGGADGLHFYRLLEPQARRFLRNGGWLLMEIGSEQGAGARNIFDNARWRVMLYQDLAGHDRIAAAQKVLS